VGDVTLAAFAVVTLVGRFTFVAFGVVRHARNLLVVGVVLLLGSRAPGCSACQAPRLAWSRWHSRDAEPELE
jgi:hypothetical protein